MGSSSAVELDISAQLRVLSWMILTTFGRNVSFKNKKLFSFH